MWIAGWVIFILLHVTAVSVYIFRARSYYVNMEPIIELRAIEPFLNEYIRLASHHRLFRNNKFIQPTDDGNLNSHQYSVAAA